MTDRQNIFDEAVKNDLMIYHNIQMLQQVKEMIEKLFVYWIISISKKIVR